MNFDLFCNKWKRNLVTAITFAYDVEKMRLIYQKKLEKIWNSISPGFTRSAILRFSKFQKKKKLFQTEDFFLQNQKNSKKYKISKKFKKSKKKTQKCVTKKIVELFGFFDFFEVFWLFWKFWIFLDFLKFFEFFETFESRFEILEVFEKLEI